jgi:hypothetical protein
MARGGGFKVIRGGLMAIGGGFKVRGGGLMVRGGDTEGVPSAERFNL